MPTLRPFRDYDEKNVINFFTPSGVTIPFNKGTLVAITGSNGVRVDLEPVEILGSFGDFSVGNTVSLRYGALPKMTTAQSGDNPLGMTLFDLREVDENGIPLKYNPRKAHEMEAAISGQAIPVVTKGTFLYSGVPLGQTPVPGAAAYLGNSGLIVTGFAGPLSGMIPAPTKVGKFLGTTGVDGSCLVWLNIV